LVYGQRGGLPIEREAPGFDVALPGRMGADRGVSHRVFRQMAVVVVKPQTITGLGAESLGVHLEAVHDQAQAGQAPTVGAVRMDLDLVDVAQQIDIVEVQVVLVRRVALEIVAAVVEPREVGVVIDSRLRAGGRPSKDAGTRPMERARRPGASSSN